MIVLLLINLLMTVDVEWNYADQYVLSSVKFIMFSDH